MAGRQITWDPVNHAVAPRPSQEVGVQRGWVGLETSGKRVTQTLGGMTEGDGGACLIKWLWDSKMFLLWGVR